MKKYISLNTVFGMGGHWQLWNRQCLLLGRAAPCSSGVYLRPICTGHSSLLSSSLFRPMNHVRSLRPPAPFEGLFCSLLEQGGGTRLSAGHPLALPGPWPCGMPGMFHPSLHTQTIQVAGWNRTGRKWGVWGEFGPDTHLWKLLQSKQTLVRWAVGKLNLQFLNKIVRS